VEGAKRAVREPPINEVEDGAHAHPGPRFQPRRNASRKA
jgi:hypothetical protein